MLEKVYLSKWINSKMKNIKTLFFPISFLFLLFIGVSCEGQIKSAMIGVNGLTCSACTRTVEMSIRKLVFVKEVKMNLENTEGEISFKEGADVDFDKISKAITNAGFSVRFLKATYLFNNLKVNKNLCFNAGKYNLQFVNTTDKVLNGESMIKFLGQKFQPKSEFSKVKPLLISSCADKDKKVYFITQ